MKLIKVNIDLSGCFIRQLKTWSTSKFKWDGVCGALYFAYKNFINIRYALYV